MSARSRTAADHAAAQLHRVRELSAWEHAAGLFDFRVDGIPAWRLVRSAQISAYLSRAEGRGRDNYNQPSVSGFLRLVGGVVRSLVQLTRLDPSRHLVIGFARRRLEGGVWVDTFFDPLIELTGPTETLCIERPFLGRHFRPTRTRNLVYYDAIRVLASLAGALLQWPVAARHGRGITPLATLVAERMGVPIRRVRGEICRALARFRIERRCARYIMKQVRPKTLLLVNRGINLAVIAAARECGARVIELQHGVMHVEGYKQGTKFDPQVDPDAFLTFGEVWNRFDWGIPATSVSVLGYRYLWQQRERLRLAGGLHGDAILLISEPGCWQKLQAPFAEIVTGHPDKSFFLKLHPQDIGGWDARYPVGYEQNVTVIEDPSADLYQLFGRCRAAVGFGSTALYEASFFGLKVCLLNDGADNPSEAIRFVGRYNFYEYSQPGDFDRMLESPRFDESMKGNPFFAEFDAAKFRSLLA